MDVEHRQLGRDDFFSLNDYLRYLHEGGFGIETEPGFSGINGVGPYSQLVGAIVGHNLYEHERSCPPGRRKWSNRLTRAQFERAYQGIALANCLGKVMDSRINITWSTLGIASDQDKLDALFDFMDLLRRWFQRNGSKLYALWVQERGPVWGLHLHVMLHLPALLIEPLKAYLPGMLQGVAKHPLITTPDVKSMLIQPRRHNPFLLDPASQWFAFRYLMKAASQDGGDVPGKRMGLSREIDETARKKWLMTNEPPTDLIKPTRPRPPMDARFVDWYREHS